MYGTRGDDRRICETSLRKYAQLNFSTPMASSSSPKPLPLHPCRPLCEPPALSAACLPLFPVRPTSIPIYFVALEFSVRLVASPRFDPSFSRRSVLFLSRLSRPCSRDRALSLSSSDVVPLPPAPPGPLALLSRRPCSRAVPLYLPPPVVLSSLKAVESNQ